MSFTITIKKELVNFEKSIEEQEAFLFGMLLTTKIVDNNFIFATTVKEIGEYFLFLLNSLFVNISYVTKTELSNVSSTTVYTIDDTSNQIKQKFNFDMQHSKYKDKVENSNKRTNCCIAGFFLVRGSVNNPAKSTYHLELLFNSSESIVYMQHLINRYGLDSKIAKRRDKFILYLKDAEKIVDLLRLMGARQVAFKFEDIRIERDFNNSINRVMNCEIANEQKTQKASLEQLKYIRYLKYNYPLEKLDPKLLLVMKVRLKNQDCSLNELLVILKDEYDVVLSKAGLSHRFTKLKTLAIEHEEGRNS